VLAVDGEDIKRGGKRLLARKTVNFSKILMKLAKKGGYPGQHIAAGEG
jgi:hypothetical protein